MRSLALVGGTVPWHDGGGAPEWVDDVTREPSNVSEVSAETRDLEEGVTEGKELSVCDGMR